LYGDLPARPVGRLVIYRIAIGFILTTLMGFFVL